MNWLKKQALSKPEKKFINDLTFKRAYERVTELARKLYPYVREQKRVAFYTNNSEEAALIFLALQGLEKEVLMLNTRLAEAEIRRQLGQLGVKTVFAQAGRATPFSEQAEQVGQAGQTAPALPYAVISFAQIEQSRAEQVALAEEYDPEHIVVIMNTSATTGEFKSVPLRWKQFAAHVQASQQGLGVTAEDNWLMVLPMFHISGLTVLLRSLYNGTRTTIVDKFGEEQVLALIAEGRVNMMSLVPTMLNRIIDRIETHYLRVVLLGGEFIPKPLVEKSVAKRIPIYKTYGMTETTSQSATFSVLDYPDKLDSVGRPLAGVEISIIDPDENGAGEVHIKSPMLMDGYLGRDPITSLNTEDLGYLDRDGFLYILDRRKNIIISGGENIYPREIENVLYAHPHIAECAVVGKKDRRWGQVPVLFIVSSLSEEEIMDYLGQKIARYKLPRRIIHLDRLPRNASGKVLIRELAERAAEL